MDFISFKVFVIAIYMVIVIFAVFKNRNMVILLKYFLDNIAIFISLLLIESGAYVSEQYSFGYNNQSFLYFSIFSFTAVLIFIYLFRNKFIAIKYLRNQNYFYSISIIYAIILFYAISTNPEYTRFNIFENIPNSVARILWLYSDIYSYVYIYSIIKEKSIHKKLSLLAAYSTLQYMRGSQFGGYFFAVIYFLISLTLQSQISQVLIASKNYLKKYQLIFGVCLSGIAIYYAFSYKSDQIGGVLELFNRATLQGHLFWGTVNILNSSGRSIPQLSTIVGNVLSFNSPITSIEYGLGYLMYQVSPIHSQSLIDSGARYTAGYPAILMLHYGYSAAFILHIISTILYAFLINLMYYILNFKSLIVFIISIKFLMFYLNEYFYMGEYHDFNLRNLIMLIIFMTLLTIHKKLKFNIYS
jgi:hypothetical protein